MIVEDSGQTVAAALLDSIVPLVPDLSERLRAGIDVLDVGCGSGRALNLMAREFPNSRFVGYDISEEAIARAEARERGTTNVRFEVRDAVALGEENRYDLITTFDAIHDQAEPARVLEGIASALRDDGVYLMQGIAGSSYVHENMDYPMRLARKPPVEGLRPGTGSSSQTAAVAGRPYGTLVLDATPAEGPSGDRSFSRCRRPGPRFYWWQRGRSREKETGDATTRRPRGLARAQPPLACRARRGCATPRAPQRGRPVGGAGARRACPRRFRLRGEQGRREEMSDAPLF